MTLVRVEEDWARLRESCPDLDLPPGLRWCLLALKFPKIADCEKALGKSGKTLVRLRRGDVSALENTGKARIKPVLMALAGQGADYDFDHWAEEFGTKEFKGESAPTTFDSFLTEPPSRQATAGRLADGLFMLAKQKDSGAFEFLPSSRRDAVIFRIWEHLQRTTGDKPILCVRSLGMAHGLTALAIHLADTRARRMDNDGRPWCYVPVAAVPGLQQHGYAAMVAWLYAFYHNQNMADVTGGSGRETVPPEEISRQIGAIRRKMAEIPAIIIFDGYSALPGEFPALLDFVDRDPLAPLLDKLVRPHVGDPGAPTEPSVFHQTRILVLGNKSLDEAIWNDESQQTERGLRFYVDKTEDYPGPEYTKLTRLIEILDLEATGDHLPVPTSIIGAMGRRSGDADISDTGVQLAWALARLRYKSSDSERSSSDSIAGWLTRLSRPARRAEADGRRPLPFADLCRDISELLKKVELEAWHAVAFIALDLGSLRRATLRRLMAVRYGDKFEMRGFNNCLSFLLEMMKGVVIEIAEHVRGDLDSDARDAEYHPSVWGTKWQTEASESERRRAYDVADADVRAAMRVVIRQSEPGEALIIERLLAEEALQQHTILARHGRTTRDEDVRSQERLVGAIFHGLMSLPPVQPCQTDPRPALSPEPSFAGLLPNDPDERLRVLYVDLYRDRLERSPQWALTRSWESLHLKRDLVKLFQSRMGPRTNCSPGYVNDVTYNAAMTALRCADHGFYKELEETFPKSSVVTSNKDEEVSSETTMARSRSARELEVQRYGKLEIEFLLSQDKFEPALHRCQDCIKAYLKPYLPHRIEDTLYAADLERRAQDLADKIVAAPEFAYDHPRQFGIVERLARAVAGQARYAAAEGEDGLPGYRAAYVLFLLVQRVRDKLVAEWRAQDYGFAASTARALARTAFFLADHARGRGDVTSEQRFAAQARLATDHMTRAVDRFPAERAHHLIIEAYISRNSSGGPMVAADLLLEAEALLPSEHERPGVNLRFLLERADVYHQLAMQDGISGEVRRRYNAIAERDNVRAKGIAHAYELPLYSSLADEQRRRHATLQAASPASRSRTPTDAAQSERKMHILPLKRAR
ncbi:MAG: hypothetical protein WB524_06395 [Acidobacteriaceae bacterium]